MLPYFSFIVAVRNCQNFISPLINSILSNTYRSYELIFVDDASVDGTKEEIKKFKNIRFISLKKQKGPAHARNLGALESKGRILVFLDADTIVSPVFFETIKHYFDSKNIDIYHFVSDKYPVAGSTSLTSIYKALEWYWFRTKTGLTMTHNQFAANGGAIKKNLFIQMRGFNEYFTKPSVESFDFAFRLSPEVKVLMGGKPIFKHYFGKFRHTYKKTLKRAFQFGNLPKIKRDLCYDNNKLFGSLASFLVFVFVLLFFVIPYSFPFLSIIFLLHLYFYRSFYQLACNTYKNLFFLLYFICYTLIMDTGVIILMIAGKVNRFIHYKKYYFTSCIK